MAKQPPKDKDATRHQPIISDSLVEGAKHNNQDAERTRERTQRIREAEDHARERIGEGSVET